MGSEVKEIKSKGKGDAGRRRSSALILAVVLTSLLAMVGVLFVISSRVDSLGTSAIAENKDLNFAVDTVGSLISEQLALDVPGMTGAESYDYAGADPGPDGLFNTGDDIVVDPWLANLEPCDVDLTSGYLYRWRQISDVTGYIRRQNWETQNISIGLAADAIIKDHEPIVLGAGGALLEQLADADGDGVADSKWIELEGATSSKGLRIYAAVRIVDNGGMLNINTVYKDTGVALTRKGDLLTDIYIDGLRRTGVDIIDNFIANRGSDPLTDTAQVYYEDVSRRIDNPEYAARAYALYDVSEELSLRNRCVLYPEDTITRLEAGSEADPCCFSTTLRAPNRGNASVPYTGTTFDRWKRRFDPFDGAVPPTEFGNNYDFRHLLTSYNMDRILRPDGGKQVNVNLLTSSLSFSWKNTLRMMVRSELTPSPSLPNPDGTAAQIVANLINYRDTDSVIADVCDLSGTRYYGFKRPCVYMSEITYYVNPEDGSTRGYAVELHKPYAEDEVPGTTSNWQITKNGTPYDVNWLGTRQFHVEVFETVRGALSGKVDYWGTAIGRSPPNGEDGVPPSAKLWWATVTDANSYSVYWGTDCNAVEAATGPASADVNYAKADASATSHDPCFAAADRGRTFCWRVDAVDVNGSVMPSINSEVWSYTIAATLADEARAAATTVLASDIITDGDVLRLEREWRPGQYVVVDSVTVPAWLVLLPGGGMLSYQRDIHRHKCIRRLWDEAASEPNSITMGTANTYDYNDPAGIVPVIQAHPAGMPFTNIGEIGMVLRRSGYLGDAEVGLPGRIYRDFPAWNTITPATGNTAATALINLADPNYQRVLSYLTVFDPTTDGIDNDGDWNGTEGRDEGQTGEILPGDDPTLTPEWKVAGRININTAPWYVIAQLPWMTPPLAQAVVAYRDRLVLGDGSGGTVADYLGLGRTVETKSPIVLRDEPGFASIAELATVANRWDGYLDDPCTTPKPDYRAFSMRYYAVDRVGVWGAAKQVDQAVFPDITTAPDEAVDDFEERDLIFQRISNLVTVRSDVFTAYILVRIGATGPQKRVIAILDRSNVYRDPMVLGRLIGKVKIRALHPVPDPR